VFPGENNNPGRPGKIIRLLRREFYEIVLNGGKEIRILQGYIKFEEKKGAPRIKNLPDIINGKRVFFVFYKEFF